MPNLVEMVCEFQQTLQIVYRESSVGHLGNEIGANGPGLIVSEAKQRIEQSSLR